MSDPEDSEETFEGLKHAYGVEGVDAARGLYDKWAKSYDDEVSRNGYVTPKRCAEALAAHAQMPWAPIMDLGCGTGLSGMALRAAGFECIDGFDLSEEMLAKAETHGIYRSLATCDMSQPLEMETGLYQNAAAIGCITPDYMPATVLDGILSKLPAGGCLTFSVNDYSAKEGSILGRINELVDTGTADLVFREYGDHLPGTGLNCTVYVLRKR